MPASRRQFLATSGLAAASGVGYWQRRRITRYPDVEELRAAREPAAPTFEAGASVSDAHLEAAHERAREIVEDGLPDDERRTASLGFLADYAPEELASATRSERREALRWFRASVRDAGRVVGEERYEAGDVERADVDDRIAEERAALADVVAPYRGGSITEAIVENGIVDDRRYVAARRIERVGDESLRSGRHYRRAWGDLAEAGAHRRDAAWHAQAVAGDDYAERMERTLERALGLLEEANRPVDVDHPDADASYAADVSRRNALVRHGSTTTEGKLEGGYLASGLRRASYQYTRRETLEAFAEIPASFEWREVRWAVDAAELPARKRAAVDAVEAALDRVGDDPLARWLLTAPVETLEGIDRSLERAIADVNDADGKRWEGSIAEASARCLQSETFAAQVPETMATLFE